MSHMGVPELMMVLMLSVFWIVPLLAGVWALVTLYRIRKGQEAMQAQIDAIARSMPPPSRGPGL